MSEAEITISAQTLLFHIRRFREMGGVLPESNLIGRWDLAEELLENSNRRFPFTLIATSVEFASQQLQDPVLGLNAVDVNDMPYSGAYVMLHDKACTLEEFIQLLSRYMCLFTEIGVYSVRHSKPHSRITFCPRDRSLTSFHQMDGALLIAAKMNERYCGARPLAAFIDHECPPGCEAVYEARFGCPVSFGQSHCSLDYHIEELTRVRRVMESPLIAARLEKRRDELYGDNIVEKSQFIIRRLLIRGEPKREHVARDLAMSVRTYQRMLSSHHTTFKALLEGTRKQLAVEHLQHNALTVQDVALLLGYSETSQFYKAFRRWFNCSPGEFRQMSDNTG